MELLGTQEAQSLGDVHDTRMDFLNATASEFDSTSDALHHDGRQLDGNGGEGEEESDQDGHRTHKRRKTSKTLQLILLRKYVKYAKQLNQIPDRITTERLLEEGYQEYFFQSHDREEEANARLGYQAFLKLIRNRRAEVTRVSRQQHSISMRSGRRSASNPPRKEQNEEIRLLIEELERVRQQQQPTQPQTINELPSAAPISYEPIEAPPELTASSVATSGSSTAVVAAASATASMLVEPNVHSASGNLPTSNDASTIPTSSDEIVLSREKLDALLRFVQQTRNMQKRILEDVRAMERRLELDRCCHCNPSLDV